VADLADACHAKGVRLHVDASYVIGKLYFRFEDIPIDFLTFDGSLLHAPKGTGGLLIKEKTLLSSPLSSTTGISVGGVSALSVALKEGMGMFDHICLETARLRDKLERGVQEGFPQAHVLFQTVERLPNCCAIAFPGVASDALLFLLHRKGVYASLGGGHCQKLSHILMACGIEDTLSQCALSFSLSFDTKEEEIDYAIKTIIECVWKLKNLSAHLLERP
jgi:cysteine desulfurase